MSYIDTINHSHVGYFASLPVYHPLQDLDIEGQDEFSATPANLVIGGGGGEHPGMVIQSLDACVWSYLKFCAEVDNKDTDEIDFFTKWDDNIKDEECYYHASYNLIYQYWGLEDITKFTLKVKEIYHNSIKYLKDKKEVENYHAEKQINVMFGEFIYYAAQHLLSPEFKEHIKNADEKLLKEEVYFYCIFNAINVIPKGYPAFGRSYILDEHNEQKIKWGLRFEDELTNK